MSNGAHSKPGAQVVNTLSYIRSTNFTVVAPVVSTGFVYFASILAEEQIQSCASIQYRDWHRQHVGEPQAPFHHAAGLATRLSRLDQSSQRRDKGHDKSRTSCSSTDGSMVSVANSAR